MYHQRITGNFDKSTACKSGFNTGQIRAQYFFQSRFAHIACGNQQEKRLARNQESPHEVGILGNDDAAFLLCSGDDFTVGIEVLPGQIKGVQCILSRYVQPVGESLRELCIDKELHAAKCSNRLTCVRRAAYESAAKMSSRSRSS